MPPAPDKSSLRKQLLEKRASLSTATAKSASHAIVEHLLAAIPTTHSIIAGYRAIRGELDISLALAALEKRGHIICLPVVLEENAPLIFRKWKTGTALIRGAYDVEIPPETSPTLIPHITLVPLVGFDANGHRLGYGAGYYDRTIASLRAHKKSVHIGIGYSFQQVAAIAANAYDEKLDAIITEEGSVELR